MTPTTSRRHLLTTIASLFTVGQTGSEHARAASTSPHRPARATEHAPATHPAYLALPGLNINALLARLPTLMNKPGDHQPIVLMDSHDYNWLHALALKRQHDDAITHHALAVGQLAQRGVIQPINYRALYSPARQAQTLDRNRTLAAQLTVSDHRTTALTASEQWQRYARGAYLDGFREQLGIDHRQSKRDRQTEQARQQKLENGLGAPVRWNKRILDKHAAALHVRRQADNRFAHLAVRGVLGERESGVLHETVDAAPRQVETDYLTDDLQPTRYLSEPDLTTLADTRSLFDRIGAIATEMVGGDDDWIMLGPTLAFPQYASLFDFAAIDEELADGDVTSEQVAEVVTTLKRQTDDTPDMASDMEWLAEQDALAGAPAAHHETMRDTADYAATLAQYTRALRSLLDDDEVSQTAALIGLSLVSDPAQTELATIDVPADDRRTEWSPQHVTDHQLTASFRRTDDYETTKEWYQHEEPAR